MAGATFAILAEGAIKSWIVNLIFLKSKDVLIQLLFGFGVFYVFKGFRVG